MTGVAIMAKHGYLLQPAAGKNSKN